MRILTLQFLHSVGIFGILLFIPLLAKDLGATPIQIGIIVTSYGFSVFLFSYIFGRFADIYGKRKFIQYGFLFASIIAFLHLLPTNWWMLAIIRIIFGISIGMNAGALIAYAYEAGLSVGRFGGYSSLGFGIGCFIMSIAVLSTGSAHSISEADIYKPLFVIASIIFLVCYFITLKLPYEKELRLRIPFLPLKIIRKNFSVYLGICLRHIGASAIWVIFPIFLYELQPGVEKYIAFFFVGIVYTINGIGQFVVMQFIDKYRSTSLLLSGFLLSSFTFLSFTICNSIWQTMLTQIPLAFAWAFMYVGALKFILERNIERATASGLLNSTLSLSQIIGPIIGGSIVAFGLHFFDLLTSYKLTMYFGASLAILAACIFWYEIKKQNHT